MVASTSPRDLQRVPASEGPASIYQALKDDGAVIIQGFLTKEEVESVNRELDGPLDRLSAGSKHTDEWTKEFHGTNTKRLTNLLSLSPTFVRAFLDNDILHGVSDRVFREDSGDFWLNTAQVIEIGPGNKAQELHRDQMQYPVFDLLGPDGPEATINFSLALTKFTDMNGATRMILGSHLWPDYREKGTPEDTIAAEMEAGDVCLFSGKVVHGGGANRTQNEKRRGVAVSVQCSYITPEEAYPFMLKREQMKAMSPRVQKMVGFRSQFPKNSPGLWQVDYAELAEHIGLA